MRWARRRVGRLAALMATGLGLPRIERKRRRKRGDFRVFILEYHDVAGTGAEVEGVISSARLGRHLRYLQRHYRLVPLSEAVAQLASSGGLSEDLVALTFDDGYAGNHQHAWPVLRATGVSATIFVTTGFLDGRGLWFERVRGVLRTAIPRAGQLPPKLQSRLRTVFGRWPRPGSVERLTQRLKYLAPEDRERLLAGLEEELGRSGEGSSPLTWEQVREMLSAGGVEIGSHTVSHPVLSTLSPSAQEEEIVGSRDRIAEETGEMPRLFSYPNGLGSDFTSVTVEALRRARFTASCTTERGSNRAGDDLFQLRRLGVGAESCAVLSSRLGDLFVSRRRLPVWRPSADPVRAPGARS